MPNFSWPAPATLPATMPPFVSVIMPVRNEAGFIAQSLGAVLSQDYPTERLEVLVADGMSTDGTRQIVADLATRTPTRSITLLDNPSQIVATGLNIALRAAKGQVIVRVDGHCRIAGDYITRCIDHLCRDGVDVVGGSINTIATTPVGQAIAAAMGSPFGVGNSVFRTVQDRTLLVDTVPFPAFSRRAVEIAGPFDEELVRNQDDEYNYRLRKLGARILLAADVRSDYHSRTTLRSLWRQYFQYGYYKVRVMQKHARQMRARHFVPPAFVLALLVGAIMSLFSPAVLGLWLLMLFGYAGTVFAATVSAIHRYGGHRPWLLVLAFLTLHFSYGFGFLGGLLRFVGRWRPATQQGDTRAESFIS